uniref:8.9 kDa family member n=1 Tax=Rhipicephalus appendiculatus TaxID=34631 RepID=A0A131YV18_RHIAP
MSITMLLLSLAVCSRVKFSNARGWFNPVPFCNGACLHRGIRVPLRGCVNLHTPCENWACEGLNDTHGNLVVTECVRVAARPPYVIQSGGNGVFPDCCPKPRRDPQYNVLWKRRTTQRAPRIV